MNVILIGFGGTDNARIIIYEAGYSSSLLIYSTYWSFVGGSQGRNHLQTPSSS
jgi:hypothetical protein